MDSLSPSNSNWLEQLEAQREAFHHGGIESVSDIGLISLLDSEYRDEIAEAVPASISRRLTSGRCFAIGYLHALAGRRSEAIDWMLRAQALTSQRGSALAARLAVELGDLYLASLQPASAETLLVWAMDRTGTRASAEILHLQALIAQANGDYAVAASLFKDTIRTRTSMSAVTRVEATINLAAAIEHSVPEEALQLCELALATISAHKLNQRYEATVENIAAYCLVLVGNVEAARTRSVGALRLASQFGTSRGVQFARFNRALIEEIGGDQERAERLFREVREAAGALGLPELAVWCDIRLAWRDLLRGNSPAATCAASSIPRSAAFHDNAMMLRGLIALYEGRLPVARSMLLDVRTASKRRRDLLMQVVSELWLAVVERRAGRLDQASAVLRSAADGAAAAGLRASTIWWSSSLIRELAAAADSEARRWLATLAIPADVIATVSVDEWGRVLMGDQPIPEGRWRLGRTGGRVLQRLCAALIRCHPDGIARDDLSDSLWPDSEGDAAVRNLYAAVNDLRKLLEPLGIRVITAGGRYGLDLPFGVAREPDRRATLRS